LKQVVIVTQIMSALFKIKTYLLIKPGFL